MRIAMVFACALLALPLAGCLDGQGALASEASHDFKPGVTTRAQAIATLGPPSSVYTAASGEKTLSWASDGGLFNPGETKALAIVFGPDDLMLRIVPAPQQQAP